MDQTAIGSGIGNYLSAEILYRAKISPHKTIAQICRNKKISDRLAKAIQDLFEQVWPKIKNGRQPSSEQPPGGTLHRGRDRKQVEYLLTMGWDTPVAELTRKAVTVGQGKSV